MNYLVVGHNYRRTSAGVRVLHKLCHLLNNVGQRAYVLAKTVNPVWNTPRADKEKAREIAEDGVVVYPEVEAGNPLGARRVVRYLLNRPGLVRGDTEFPASELLFCYCGLLRRFVPSDDRVLTVPVVDVEMFHDSRLERDGETFWVGKGKHIPQVWDHAGMREITLDWPEDWHALAALFNTVRMFYSYAEYTMLTVEARLCGCPSVVIPSGFYSKDEFAAGSPGGIAGLAWGPSLVEMERARRSVEQFRVAYLKQEARFANEQFWRFVNITQEASW